MQPTSESQMGIPCHLQSHLSCMQGTFLQSRWSHVGLRRGTGRQRSQRAHPQKSCKTAARLQSATTQGSTETERLHRRTTCPGLAKPCTPEAHDPCHLLRTHRRPQHWNPTSTGVWCSPLLRRSTQRPTVVGSATLGLRRVADGSPIFVVCCFHRIVCILRRHHHESPDLSVDVFVTLGVAVLACEMNTGVTMPRNDALGRRGTRAW